MKNRKLFIVLCSFVYGVLFPCQVPEGTNLAKLERQAINNVMQKQREDYINYYNSHPDSEVKKRCLNSPDQHCVKIFYDYKKSVLLNKEKNNCTQ